MWNSFYLKFPDEQITQNAMLGYGSDIAFDVLGDISTPEQMGPDGILIPLRHVDGYHVNVRVLDVDLPDTLKSYQIPEPIHPKRVWL
jgi:hypothetical protein